MDVAAGALRNGVIGWNAA